ncbi:MAG: hypothetical protein QOJ65_161 [Fimbriimonadaceae bacterium]|jgi:hypothetical protein|nr:hypothetical protein [Fimbriimonadaceae bacterium]
MKLKRLPAIVLSLFIGAVTPAVFPDTPTAGYRAVGMIGKTNTGSFAIGGSGVAISPDWVVGVSHVGGDTFVLNGQQYPILQKIIHKVSEGEPADLALYKLGKPVPAYTRVLLAPFEGASVKLNKRTVLLVGYGRNATLRPDGLGWLPTAGTEGVKRVATNTIDLADTERYNIGSETTPRWKSSVCLAYDLDKPGDPSFSTLGTAITDKEGGVAAKDSGGGWFVSYGGQTLLVAVSCTVGKPKDSTLPSDYCYGAMGFGIHLYAYRDWIYANTGLADFAPTTAARKR